MLILSPDPPCLCLLHCTFLLICSPRPNRSDFSYLPVIVPVCACACVCVLVCVVSCCVLFFPWLFSFSLFSCFQTTIWSCQFAMDRFISKTFINPSRQMLISFEPADESLQRKSQDTPSTKVKAWCHVLPEPVTVKLLQGIRMENDLEDF